jgi:glycosyltransferase involved in cell wall biosynthesis
MLKKHWVPKEKVVVVHNGIETDWVNGKKLNTTQPIIGMIADFNKYKAQQDLVVAASEVLKKFPNAKFVLAGEGENKKKIFKLIKHLRLDANFVLNGFVGDVRKILSELSIFVLATYTEGLPVSIIEAMLFGLPVVASRVGGIPELVEDGVTGILVKPESSEELASAIIELLTNQEKANRMCEMGKLRVKQYFTIEQMMQKLESLYLGLAKSKGLFG